MKTVGIVVPSFNQPLLLTKCITSVRAQGKRVADVIVIDDNSNEETKEVTKHLDGIRPFFNQGNSGWIKNCNRGVKKTNTDYVMVLNSDVELLPNAIENMAKNLDDGAGACGMLLMYPQNHPNPYARGRVQHAGVYIEMDGFPTHFLAHAHPRNPAVTTWRSINIVTGAAMMVDRAVWEKLNGLDERFGMGVFEDVAFCLSVRKLGKEVIYEPKAQGWHMEHGSQPSHGGWFTGDAIQRNLGLLFQNYGVPKCDIDLFCKVR